MITILISRMAGNLAYLLSGISHNVGLWPVKKMVRLMVILIFESWTDISSTMRLWPTNIDIWSPICGDVFCCCKELYLVCLVKIALQGIYIKVLLMEPLAGKSVTFDWSGKFTRGIGLWTRPQQGLRFSVAILAQVDWLNRPAEEAAFQLGPASLPDPMEAMPG